ncbi:MAG: glycosyltransferase family 4 protein [Deltaproteobacteria bacterium]|nr:glycosyltransferase family 4 protein [Deltaproteobacteria bacterium]
MKILYLHQYFNTPAMSGGTRSYEMARRFVQSGHEVHIITTSREGDHKSGSWRMEMVDGIHVHWIDISYSNSLSYLQRVRAFVHFAWAGAIKAARVGGDIVLATSTPLTVALPGIYSSKRLKVPMVFEVRDLWPELPVAVGALKNPILIKAARWLERFAYHNSSHIIALSPGMADGIRATGYLPEKISVIPNSADIKDFQITDDETDIFLRKHGEIVTGPLVVYAGTLGIINGVDYLVDIAAEMIRIDPEVRFLIVGGGKEAAFIEQKAAHLGVLEENLWMLPPIPKNEMPALLSAATVATSLFIDLPEMWNNSANKFFDALAAGKPLMINYQGWHARLLEQSGAGIVVPPGSPEKATLLLHELLCSEERLVSAQVGARQLAEKKFNRDDLAAELLDILQQTGEK